MASRLSDYFTRTNKFIGFLASLVAVLSVAPKILNMTSLNKATNTIEDLHEIISSTNQQALSAIPSFYVDTVDFFGETRSLESIISEKERMFQKWPVRVYIFSLDEKNLIAAGCDARLSAGRIIR